AQSSSDIQDAVSQGALAVIDVRDDGEVADSFGIDGHRLVACNASECGPGAWHTGGRCASRAITSWSSWPVCPSSSSVPAERAHSVWAPGRFPPGCTPPQAPWSCRATDADARFVRA